MIETIDLSKQGISTRIDVTNAINLGIRLQADTSSAAVVELKKAIGPTLEGESFGVPVFLSLAGGSITEVDCSRFSHLVVEVVTPGTGLAQLEHNTYGLIPGWVELLELDLTKSGVKWDRGIGSLDRRISIAVDLQDSTGSPAMYLSKALDPLGALVRASALNMNGSIVESDLKAIARIGIDSAVDADTRANVWIYVSANPESAGISEEGLAYLAKAQEFTGTTLFSGGFQIGDLSSGLHTITSSSTANNALEIPDTGGEVAVVSDPTPADDEFLVRSGAGYLSTGMLLAEDGTLGAPSIGFADDPNNGIYRDGSDEWGLVVGGHEVCVFSTIVSGLISVVSFDTDILNIKAVQSWVVQTDDMIIGAVDTSTGALISLKEGSTNGSGAIGLKCPDALSVSETVDYELPVKPSEDNSTLKGDADGSTRFEPGVGTSFPTSPYDGQQYRRTDLNHELFYWDDARSKWLGDRLIPYSFSRSGTQTGTFILRLAGAEFWTSTQGIPTPGKMCFTQYRMHSRQAFTANIEAREGSSTLVATEATGASSQFHHADDVDITFDADSGSPHKWFRLTILTGTSDGLTGTFFLQRDATGE